MAWRTTDPAVAATLFAIVGLFATTSDDLWASDARPDRWTFVVWSAIAGVILGLVFSSRPVKLAQHWIARILRDYQLARWLSGLIGFFAVYVGDFGVGARIVDADRAIPSLIGIFALRLPIDLAVVTGIGLLASEPLTAPAESNHSVP